MSVTMLDPTEQEEKTFTPPPQVSARDAFTQQTGQALITLGMIFKHVPPFNESIEKSTSDTLISIGKKLKGTR